MLPQLVARLDLAPKNNNPWDTDMSVGQAQRLPSPAQLTLTLKHRPKNEDTLIHKNAPPPRTFLASITPLSPFAHKNSQTTEKKKEERSSTSFCFAVCLAFSLPELHRAHEVHASPPSGLLRERLLNETYPCSFRITGNSTGAFQTEGLNFRGTRDVYSGERSCYPTANARSSFGPGRVPTANDDHDDLSKFSHQLPFTYPAP